MSRHRLALCAIATFSIFHLASVAYAVSPNIVISQVYGGGGNATAIYTNDFIELFNRGNTAVSLNGWSVQYASSTGTSWVNKTNLSNITLQPGQYYLIQGASGGANGTSLPTADVIGSINMSATAGKLALVNTTTTIGAISCPNASNGVVDFVGFGAAANCSELSPTTAPSNNTAVIRAGGGCTDTDSNSSDFATATLPLETHSLL